MEVKDDVTKEMPVGEQELIDLPVADEQTDETKGGTASKATPKLFLHCATGQHY